MTDAAPPVPTEPQLTLAQQLVVARRACTVTERKWLGKLQEHDFSPWRTGIALGMSKRTVFTFLRRARVRKVMDLMDQMAVEDLGISRLSILQRYVQIADSNIKRFFNGDELKAANEWDDSDAAAVAEYSFDVKGNPKIKLHDKKAANDSLARILKLFGPERFELTGKNGERLPSGPVFIIAREEANQIGQALDQKI